MYEQRMTYSLLIHLQCGDRAHEQDLKCAREECESLKKNLKWIVEVKRKMERQRDDAGRQLDELEEKMEVRSVKKSLF